MISSLISRRTILKLMFADLLAGVSLIDNANSSSGAVSNEEIFQHVISNYQKRLRIPVITAVFGRGKDQYVFYGGADETTLFPLASVSKVFTATLLLLLAEKHKIDLKDSIRKYFDQLPDSFENVKILNLVTHTGGLALSGGNAQHRAAYLCSLGSAGLRFPPGEQMEYNNPAYVLLGWIVEKITEQNFADSLVSEICQPLKLKNTFVPNNGFVDYQSGHKFDKNRLVPASAALEFQTMGGTAGLVSCASDLGLFASALLSGKLLSAISLAKMFEPIMLNSRRPAGTAFCWEIAQGYGSRLYKKNGNIEGFSTWLAVVPSKQTYFAVLGNLGGVNYEQCNGQIFERMGGLKSRASVR